MEEVRAQLPAAAPAFARQVFSGRRLPRRSFSEGGLYTRLLSGLRLGKPSFFTG